MTYEQTLDYLYRCFPMFQKIGSKAYKAGLETTQLLDDYLNMPHRTYQTIHVGGTNGKGSVSHSLAAVLQSAGYKVGLYTSPHLVDFSERIRVNGEPVNKSYVVEFIRAHRPFFEPLSPSFFELTTAMAFSYFAEMNVDVAVIEVGLGGRLDCTNIITPQLSIITNISFDHTALLGDTLSKIAYEKAGIIKPHIPVVIGESNAESSPVFSQRANEVNAPIYFADVSHMNPVLSAKRDKEGYWVIETLYLKRVRLGLKGHCQLSNAATILCALDRLIEQGFLITNESIEQGLWDVVRLTGLRGRWEVLGNAPRIICDTGHNEAGIRQIVTQLSNEHYHHLHFIIGVVNDKDISAILGMLPTSAFYYFTQASVSRALPAKELKAKAESFGLQGDVFPSVYEAFNTAKEKSTPSDLIFIGGSTFTVADLLIYLNEG